MKNNTYTHLCWGLIGICCLLFYHTGSAQCTIQSPNNACAGEEVTFEVGNPEPGRTYEWDFNEDGIVDAQGLTATFRFPGAVNARTYEVELLRDGNPCASRNINISRGPDASLGVNPADGEFEDGEIRVCTNESRVTVGFFNSSSTISINESYEIAWGDGSVDTYTNSTFTATRLIQHTYTEQGYKEITLRVRSVDGCEAEQKYLFYYGGNPSVGLVNPGNTTGLCVGESITFPISETANNPQDTKYEIYINDMLVGDYDQNNVPSTFTYTFDESSCGLTTPSSNFKHAFEVRMLARTPCGTSSATIAPIEVSAPPELELTIDEPSSSCVGEVFKFKNTSSTQEISTKGNVTQCVTELDASWAIDGPGDFEVINGNVFSSEELEVSFDVPGTYGVTVTVTSSVCGAFTLTDSIEVSRETQIQNGDIRINYAGATACVPSVVPIDNDVQNADNFRWRIIPNQGWEFETGSASSREPSIRFTEGGEYVIELTASNACQSDTWRDTIEVRGAPAVGLRGIPNFCNEAELNFDNDAVQFRPNGNTITGYEWSFPGSNQATTQSQFPTNVQFNNPGTYTVTATATNSCGTGVATRTFTVESPIDATIPDTIEVCGNGDPISLTAAPGGGEWTGVGISSDGNFDPAEGALGANFVYYEVGIGACADIDTTLIQLLDYPILDLGADSALCVTEDTFRLTPNLTGGTWVALDGGQLLGDQFLPNASGPGSYAFRYELTNVNACTSSDTLQLRVVESANISIPDTAYCDVPGSFDLPTPNLNGGIWSGPGINADQFEPRAAGGPGSYQIQYAFSDPNFCPTVVPITIRVDSLPLVDAGPEDSVCVSEPQIELVGLPAGGQWSGPGIDPFQPDIFKPELVGAGRFILFYSFGEGSCRVQDSTRINILSNPNVFAGPDRQICADDTTFVLLGNTPVGGEWQGPGITNNFSGEFDPDLVPIGSVELIYSYTFPGVDCFGQDTIRLTKHPLPSPIFDLPPTYCLGDTITIIDRSIGAFAWDWTFEGAGRSNRRNPSIAFDSAGIYTISLLVESDFGCTDTISNQMEIIPPPIAAFGMNFDQDCAPVETVFENRSSGIDVTYEWDFGNGETSSEENPTPVLFNSAPRDTIFEIKLTASNQCGEQEFVDTVQVLTVPTVGFGFSVDTSCSPLTTQILNQTSGGVVSVFWDLGNGNFSDDFNPPPQTYIANDQPITYDVTMVARNACGVDSLTRPMYVKPANVEAFISLPQSEGCAPFTIDFPNFTTIGSRLVWDFGDGTTSNELTPSHTYLEPGDYRVIQYAENGCGIDSTSVSLSVLPPPTVAFDMNMPGCLNQPLAFENLSADAEGFQWWFDSLGTSSIREPIFAFPDTGTFTVTLEGTSPFNGCSARFSEDIYIRNIPDIQLEQDENEGCEPLTVSFNAISNQDVRMEWDFGDGNSSSRTNPEHLFVNSGTYLVTVTAMDTFGCRQASDPASIQVNPKPEVQFTPMVEQDCTLPARFNMNNETEDADTYSWNFGNATNSSLNNPIGEYPEPGEYKIFLLAENIYGCVDSGISMVSIPIVPLADFDFEPGEGCDPLDVQFTNLSESADEYLWSFGDGTFSAEMDPIHRYYDPGQYDVQLIASADNYCRDTFTLPGIIRIYGTPTASFEAIPVSTDPFDGRYLFKNLSVGAETFFWDFGDGNISRDFSPQHRFRNDEVRQIYLEAIGEAGCKDDTLLVLQPPALKGLHIPTGFSPQNGLGDVRLFKPTGIGLKEYHMQIFSSYGELLWETTLLDDGQPVESWDGTVNGQLQPQDVYVWKCRAVFKDGTIWRGQKAANGKLKNIGSLVLLR